MGEKRWTQDYKRTWEFLEETATSAPTFIQETAHEALSRPILRDFTLILDFSKSVMKMDFKPSRLKQLQEITKTFWANFYNNNPISSLHVIAVQNGLAREISADEIDSLEGCGDFSLENGLRLTLLLLDLAQRHWSLEVLVISNSLWTCDPGDLWDAVDQCRERRVKINVVSLSPEVHALRQTTVVTGGSYSLALNEQDLAERWHKFSLSGGVSRNPSLIPMGFPVYTSRKGPCADTNDMQPGYVCPVCRAKVTTLPTRCPVCGFTLLSLPYLARALLALTPLPLFLENTEIMQCVGCGKKGQSRKCPTCGKSFWEAWEDLCRTGFGKCFGCM